ncbi:MAG: gluconate permease [Saprospiraceae bacterium]|nr:gluconate permease [Saprospiraceae bacterium]
MSIVLLIGSIAFLLLLIAVVRLNAFVALIITALTVGILRGMPFAKLIESIQKGIGSTMGSLVMIIGFGVMLGSLLADSGAAQQISSSLIRIFGAKRAKWALVITSFTVGLAMFYNAGFVILIPLVFSVAAATELPLVYLGIAMASGLSVTHGYLPPHPGPTAIAVLFKADMGKTLVYGIPIAIVAILISGVLFPEFLKKIVANPPQGLVDVKNLPENELPSFPLSMTIALSPVLLMAAATIGEFALPKESFTLQILKFVGDASISMLISFGLAVVFLGILRGRKMVDITEKTAASITATTMILMIVAAGGAFKQVLQDSGIGNDIAAIFKDLPLSPLVLAWLIATIIRITIGSATVAGLTAAGIIQPLMNDPSVAATISPELMVLSVGAGSLMCSHVNDTGFWMFKEYFGLSLKDTFKTWTIMETIVGIVGLIGVVILDWIV